jgi:cephalosporin hydroxylase
MRIELDTASGTLTVEENSSRREVSLYTPEAFQLISTVWLKAGWGLKHSYTFTWLGRPIVQLPEDLLRIQEVIYRVRPDLLIETGIAHGGSLLYYASLFHAIGKGRVIGIDIEIRPSNRKAIESSEMSHLITLLEGSSTSPEIVRAVKEAAEPAGKVMVVLDSDHTREHVLSELEAFAPFVTDGSYIVATDGIMQDLTDAPGGAPQWRTDNPTAAARDFAQRHGEFVIEQPEWLFNESKGLSENITYWPGAYLRRVRSTPPVK